MMDLEKLERILESVRQPAIDYQELTGKPLGITGEFGEYMTAELLGLELAVARKKGYDATDKKGRRIQIKARRIPREKNPDAERLGSIRLDREWDCVMFILLDEKFAPQAIYEAQRGALQAAIEQSESKAMKRGALSINKFKSLGKKIWSADSG